MSRPTRAFALLAALLSTGAAIAACSANGGGSTNGGAGGAGGGGGPGGSGGLGGGLLDASGGDDAFDPDAACGYAKIQTEREPGSILIVLDRSYSMSDAPDGNQPSGGTPSKWDSATEALTTVLGGLASDVGVGLLTFPASADGCGSDQAPQVAVGPVATTKSAILSTLGIGPGGNTPTDQALDIAYGYLDGLPSKGGKAVMLITDGAWNCWTASLDPNAQTQHILDQAATVHAASGILTFAIGVPGSSDNDLSQLAHAGGTDRTPTCVPACQADIFNPKECCDYSTDASSFQTDLVKAIDDIASRFLTNCVFAVPKGADPSLFDPGKVNVIVTDGGKETVVGKDPTTGWSYVGSGDDQLEIHGPACDAILHGNVTVEILLGCPTGSIK